MKYPLLTKLLFENHKESLTGIFQVAEDIDADINLHKDSYVVLKNGIVHNDDGPALIDQNVLVYAKNNIAQNLDGPAEIAFSQKLNLEDHYSVSYIFSTNGIERRILQMGTPNFRSPYTLKEELYYLHNSYLPLSREEWKMAVVELKKSILKSKMRETFSSDSSKKD